MQKYNFVAPSKKLMFFIFIVRKLNTSSIYMYNIILRRKYCVISLKLVTLRLSHFAELILRF